MHLHLKSKAQLVGICRRVMKTKSSDETGLFKLSKENLRNLAEVLIDLENQIISLEETISGKYEGS